MTEIKRTGGLYDFVDKDNLEHLDNKLGRHAPRMGWKKKTLIQKIKEFFRRILK